MACIKLFGEITVAFECIKYTEHRLKLFGSFDRQNHCIVFSINKTYYLNKQVVWLVGVVHTNKIWLPTSLS